jgi:hypothetical protein
MVSAQATSEPAPEPRPGPTGMPCALAHLDEVGDDQEVARNFISMMTSELELEPSPGSAMRSGSVPWRCSST